MDGFSVVPSELTNAARTIRELGEQLMASPALSYGISPRAVGNDTLALAVGQVQAASRRSVWVLSTTARATADRLSDTAATYRTLDWEQAETITALGDDRLND